MVNRHGPCYNPLMLEKPPVSDQLIIDCLHTSYGIDVSDLTFLPMGADMNSAVYKAQAHGQATYFVKLKHGHAHDVGVLVRDLLCKAGIKHIIPVVKTKTNQLSQQIGAHTIIVSPFVEGEDGFTRDLSEDHWVTLGMVMRQVHELMVPPAIETLLSKETYAPKFRDMVRSYFPLIDSEPRGDEVAIQLHTFMKQHASQIHLLVDRAEQLSQKIQNLSPHLVLCHSDLHAGNVLIDKYGQLYIVDWDEPILAPKERDLMFIGAGVGNVWNKAHEVELFYQGYGSAEVNREILAYYRIERIVVDIAEYVEALLLTSEGGQDRHQSYLHFIGQFEPRGVVDIAFETDASRGHN
jgi:spectinomycin phosphotransferase